jgi:hypothetical protein
MEFFLLFDSVQKSDSWWYIFSLEFRVIYLALHLATAPRFRFSEI